MRLRRGPYSRCIMLLLSSVYSSYWTVICHDPAFPCNHQLNLGLLINLGVGIVLRVLATFLQQTQRGGGWAASLGQASYRGDRPWPGHLQGGGRLWPRPPTKGRLAAAKALCIGVGRLRPARRGGKRLRAWPLAVRHPQGQSAARGEATERGGARRLCRGHDDGCSDTERDEEDLGHSF
ncbi:hypothetical protein GW17_00036806 [Ensete ventricosum]|nr:hypothetical protein GW17_00036806 [Ensete ventricosum]